MRLLFILAEQLSEELDYSSKEAVFLWYGHFLFPLIDYFIITVEGYRFRYLDIIKL